MQYVFIFKSLSIVAALQGKTAPTLTAMPLLRVDAAQVFVHVVATFVK